jgi:hypothetical protein
MFARTLHASAISLATEYLSSEWPNAQHARNAMHLVRSTARAALVPTVSVTNPGQDILLNRVLPSYPTFKSEVGIYFKVRPGWWYFEVTREEFGHDILNSEEAKTRIKPNLLGPHSTFWYQPEMCLSGWRTRRFSTSTPNLAIGHDPDPAPFIS